MKDFRIMEKKLHKIFHNSQFDLHTAVIKTHTTTYLMLNHDGRFTLPLRGPPSEQRSVLTNYSMARFMHSQKCRGAEPCLY